MGKVTPASTTNKIRDGNPLDPCEQQFLYRNMSRAKQNEVILNSITHKTHTAS